MVLNPTRIGNKALLNYSATKGSAERHSAGKVYANFKRERERCFYFSSMLPFFSNYNNSITLSIITGDCESSIFGAWLRIFDVEIQYKDKVFQMSDRSG